MKKNLFFICLMIATNCCGMDKEIDILSIVPFAPKKLSIDPLIICAQVIKSFEQPISAKKRNNVDIHLTFCPRCSELFAAAKPNIPTLKDLHALSKSKL